MFGHWPFGINGAHLRWKWWLEEMVMQWSWWMWLVRDLVVQLSFTLLLAEDVQVVLHVCETRSLHVDVLPMSFGALHCSLRSHNGLLLLLEPLDLLLDFG
jgi:hypothetical protein